MRGFQKQRTAHPELECTVLWAGVQGELGRTPNCGCSVTRLLPWCLPHLKRRNPQTVPNKSFLGYRYRAFVFCLVFGPAMILKVTQAGLPIVLVVGREDKREGVLAGFLLVIAWTKASWGEEGVFGLHFPVTVRHEGRSGQSSTQRCSLAGPAHLQRPGPPA